MEINPRDEVLEQALQFAENKRLLTQSGISNLYVAREYDKQGNLINTTFGSNLMTNFGIEKYMRSRSGTIPTKIYFGFGTGQQISTNDSTLLSPYVDITNISGSTSGTNRNYACPLYYKKSEIAGEPGLITCICKFMSATMGYNVTTDGRGNFSITEYGIGDSMTQLWTHSWVYNNIGQTASIPKTPEIQIVFDIYFCMTYTTDLMQTCYSNGIYPILTSMETFVSNKDHIVMPQFCGSLKADRTFVSRQCYSDTISWESNIITTTRNMHDFVIYGKDQVTSDYERHAYLYSDGFLGYSEGFQIAERQQLTTPEEITLYEFFNPSYLNNDGLTYNFGKDVVDNKYAIPITQIDIDKTNHPSYGIYLYNYKTHAWDISEEFLNNPEVWYNETLMEPKTKRYHVSTNSSTQAQTVSNNNWDMTSCKIYYRNADGDIVTMYLHQNLDTSNPIIGFNTTMSTIYCTDEYWDTSTWRLLTNTNVVPSDYGDMHENLQIKKYWIVNDDNGNILLNPKRAKQRLTLQPFSGLMTSTLPQLTDRIYPMNHKVETDENTVSDIKGYIVFDNKIFDFTNNTTYQISSYANDSIYVYNDYILSIYNYNNKYFITNMSSDHRGETTSYDSHFATSTKLRDLYKTESGTGLICLSNINNNGYISDVIDLRSDLVVCHKISNNIMACCIYGTNLIACIDKDSTQSLLIYDIDDLTTPIKTISLSSKLSSQPTMICGHTNYIWAMNDTECCYVYLPDNIVETCDEYLNPGLKSSYGDIRFSCLDDMFVVYNSNNSDITSANYVLLSSPSRCKRFTTISGISIYPRINMILSKVKENAIALLYQGQKTSGNYDANNIIIDFGQYLDTGNYVYLQKNAGGERQLIPFGDYYYNKYENTFIPKEYCLQHKIVGTTKTITTLNTQKKMGNKSWTTQVTNIGQYVPDGPPKGQESDL